MEYSTFEEIVDQYIKTFHNEPTGKKEMKCKYGHLTFHKYPENNAIIIYEIYVNSNVRRNGYCRNILEHLVERYISNQHTIVIETVFSNVLYNYLIRFQYKKKKFAPMQHGFQLVDIHSFY